MALLPTADKLPWWAATVAGCAAIAAHWLPPVWLAWGLFAAIAVAGMAVDLLHDRHRLAVLPVALIVAWVCAANLTLPLLGSWGLVYACLTLVWLATVIGWRAFAYKHKWIAELELKMDHRRALHRVRGNWPKFAHQAGIPDDSTLEDAHATANGIVMDVLVPGDASALTQREGGIASALAVGADKVQVTTDPGDAGRAHVYVRTVDPFATKPRGWEPPDDDYSIRYGMTVGPDENGRPVKVDFVQEHWQVTGITRSGKTHVLQMACACAGYARDAELIIIDTVKKGADFGRYRHLALMYAVDADQAATALETVYAAMTDRYATRARERRTGNWRPGIEGPQLVVVIDEAANACRDNAIQDLLMLLAAESSGAGITLIVGTQSPQHRIFDVNTRRNLGTKIALATDSAQASDLALDQGFAALGYDCSALPKSGHCWIKTTTGRRPIRSRAWWVEDRELDQAALRRPDRRHLAPHLDLITPEVLPQGTPAPIQATTTPHGSESHTDGTHANLTAPGGGLATVLDHPGSAPGLPPPDVPLPQHTQREEPPGAASPQATVAEALAACGLQYAAVTYELLVAHGPLSQTAVSRGVPCTNRTAARTLGRLVERRLARRSGDLWAAVPAEAFRG